MLSTFNQISHTYLRKFFWNFYEQFEFCSSISTKFAPQMHQKCNQWRNEDMQLQIIWSHISLSNLQHWLQVKYITGRNFIKRTILNSLCAEVADLNSPERWFNWTFIYFLEPHQVNVSLGGEFDLMDKFNYYVYMYVLSVLHTYLCMYSRVK